MVEEHKILVKSDIDDDNDLDDDDPVIVTLHNILMVAHKTEGTKYD